MIVAVFGFIALGIGAIGIHDQKIRSATTGNKELVSASSSAAIDRKLQRLEFLQQRDNPVKLVRFLIRSQRALTPDELGHFRVLLEIIDLGTGDSHPTVWIGARDSYIEASYGGQTTKLDGLQTIVWSRAPDEILQDTYVGTVYGRQIPEILAWGAINNRGPFPTIASFDNKWLHVFVTESLFDKIEYIGFAIDGYVIMRLPVTCLDAEKRKPLWKWPKELSEAEEANEWVELVPKRYWPNDNSRPPLRPPLQIDFSKVTPES